MVKNKDKSAPEVSGSGEPGGTQGEEDRAVTGTKPDVTDARPCEERLAEAERKGEEFRDQALRASAELENTRKRTAKEVERIRKYALESFALELLVVKDNLERGLDDRTEAKTIESAREGARLTLKSLERAFAKFGIEEVSPVGQTFDPELHQAMSTVETDECEPNTVAEVAQKGYLLNGRLIRPAMVMVSRPKTAGGNEEESAS